jgi:ketosteroid isomerase-like protein
MLEKQIQRTFDAVERKDLGAVMQGWADDGVLEFPGRSAIGGRYEGKPAIEGFFRRWFQRMATIRLTVRHVAFANPLTLNYRNTMFVEFETDQLTVEGASLHTEVLGVYRFEHRKLVFYREYLFDADVAMDVWGPAMDPAA